MRAPSSRRSRSCSRCSSGARGRTAASPLCLEEQQEEEEQEGAGALRRHHRHHHLRLRPPPRPAPCSRPPRSAPSPPGLPTPEAKVETPSGGSSTPTSSPSCAATGGGCSRRPAAAAAAAAAATARLKTGRCPRPLRPPPKTQLPPLPTTSSRLCPCSPERASSAGCSRGARTESWVTLRSRRRRRCTSAARRGPRRRRWRRGSSYRCW